MTCLSRILPFLIAGLLLYPRQIEARFDLVGEFSGTVGLRAVFGSNDITVTPVAILTHTAYRVEQGIMIEPEFAIRKWNEGGIGSGLIPHVFRISWYAGIGEGGRNRNNLPHDYVLPVQHKRFAGYGRRTKFATGIGQTWTIFSHDPNQKFRRSGDPLGHVSWSFYLKYGWESTSVRVNINNDWRATQKTNLLIVPFLSGDSGYGDGFDDLETMSAFITVSHYNDSNFWEGGISVMDMITDRILRNKENRGDPLEVRQYYHKDEVRYYKTWGPGGVYEGDGDYEGIGLYRVFAFLNWHPIDKPFGFGAKIGLHGPWIQAIQNVWHDHATHTPRFPVRYKTPKFYYELSASGAWGESK